MELSTRIYLAGHSGLAGSALRRQFEKSGYKNLLMRTHDELDLTDQSATLRFFQDEKPEIVVLAAGKVGGIIANNSLPAEFLYTNLAIQNNVIRAAVRSSVSDLLFLGSSCIYPRDCRQPIKEEYLLSGPLESTNRPYALAKIAGVEHCWACNRQYGVRYFAVMPTNLYGLGDNYDAANSHVLPALIRRTHEAKVLDASEVFIWGSGAPRREFLFSEDLAEACVFLLENNYLVDEMVFAADKPPIVNIGVGEDIPISKLAEIICEIIGFKGKLTFDVTKPDGTPQKLLDNTKITKAGWRPTTTLEGGIRIVYDDYLRMCNA